MTPVTLGQKIRSARLKKNLTQVDLAQLLTTTKGNKTVSSWETGNAMPNLDAVEQLCYILDVEPNYFFNVVIADPTWQKVLTDAYEAADRPIQEAACAVLRIPHIEAKTVLGEKQIEMIIYQDPAAAGIPLHADSDFERMLFPEGQVPRGADFGIRIQGTSMEPTILDGSIAWVRKTYDLQNGQIGIFMIDDEAVCKRYHKTADGTLLKSDNPAYAPIALSDFERFGVVGRVLGYK